jgi:hypothetical protein
MVTEAIFSGFSKKKVDLNLATGHASRKTYYCDPKKTSQKYCISKSTHRNSSVLLWGDSNADHYVGMLGALSKSLEFNFAVSTATACPSLINTKKFTSKKRKKSCDSRTRALIPYLTKYQTIILASQWVNYYQTKGFEQELVNTVEQLLESNLKIIILAQVPLQNNYDRMCEVKKLRVSFLDCAKPTRQNPIVTAVNKVMDQVANKYNDVSFVSINEILCTDGECKPHVTDISDFPLYFDKSHLSLKGSWELGRYLVKTQQVPVPFKNLSAIL